jgi:hypothetical protein
MVLPDRIELSTSPLPMECLGDKRPLILETFSSVSGTACQKRATITSKLRSTVGVCCKKHPPCQAHNLKVIGSNPIPATKQDADITAKIQRPPFGAAFYFSRIATESPRETISYFGGI